MVGLPGEVPNLIEGGCFFGVAVDLSRRVMIGMVRGPREASWGCDSA